ncbi:hypothetical protein OOK41_02830 [Micromonospora sp. NBC_01655]|uniref:hypothetical protein n=1 Tax=Micromonospora sp. NBC_01655 TaxID=2975983 RepID=UPI00224E85D6|nr:hypothetical protein [Micromonospora sp. NBC_01655]MCX4469259.1 hypothetical protein [Micromonospora sp. NBC_01655]
MSHRGGRHRSRRGWHCACQVCRAYRAAKPKPDPAPADPRPAPRPAPPPRDPVPYDPPLVGRMIPPYRGPRNDVSTRVTRGLAGELRTPAQLRRENEGRR